MVLCFQQMSDGRSSYCKNKFTPYKMYRRAAKIILTFKYSDGETIHTFHLYHLPRNRMAVHFQQKSNVHSSLHKSKFSAYKMYGLQKIYFTKNCDRACKNRACGLKYTMSFDETYLNIEMQYLDFVNSVVKPNKLSTNLENFVAVPYRNKKL